MKLQKNIKYLLGVLNGSSLIKGRCRERLRSLVRLPPRHLVVQWGRGRGHSLLLIVRSVFHLHVPLFQSMIMFIFCLQRRLEANCGQFV
jgi:hypothetical protein